MWRFFLYCLVTAIGIGIAASPFLPFVFLYVPIMWHAIKTGYFDVN